MFPSVYTKISATPTSVLFPRSCPNCANGTDFAKRSSGTKHRTLKFLRQGLPSILVAASRRSTEIRIADGTLSQNQGDGLIDKLNQIRLKLDGDRTGGACNQLSSFIRQVDAFIDSRALNQTQGQSLINSANTIKTSLGC